MGLLEDYGSGGLLDFAQTWYQNRQNTKNAHEQMDFQKYMYMNRYQMQVQDLMAAGLNPMLAYQQSPGSSPQGAMARAEKSDVGRSAMDLRIASAQEANIRANTQKAIEESDNIAFDTLTKMGMPELIAAQVRQASASAQQSEEMVKQIRATIPKIDAEIKSLEQKIQLDKSNIRLNNSLIELNHFKNGLTLAETYLTNQRTATERHNTAILDPKAKAANTTGAQAGHYAEQSFGKVIKALNPFNFSISGQ